MQSSSLTPSSIVPTNSRSGFSGSPGVVSHRTGWPVPFGKTVAKPSSSPSSPNFDIAVAMSAPSARPWKSTTSGIGSSSAARAGAVCRHHRSVPPSSTACRSLSWASVAAPQPGDGTGGGSVVVVDSGAVVVVVEEPPPASVAPSSSEHAARASAARASRADPASHRAHSHPASVPTRKSTTYIGTTASSATSPCSSPDGRSVASMPSPSPSGVWPIDPRSVTSPVSRSTR